MNFSTEIKNSLANLFKARFPYIYIPTWEESRACELVKEIAKDESVIKVVRKVYVWNQTDGFADAETGKKISDTATPIKGLEFVDKNNENAIYIFKDLHNFFGVSNRNADYALIRKMRNLIPVLREGQFRENIVLVSPQLIIPEDMQKEISVFEFPFPTVNEIYELLNQMLAENGINSSLSDADKVALSKSALGLTLQEAENAFSRAIVKNKGLDKEAIGVIFEEKNQVIRKTGILEFIKSDLDVADIGGLENLKNWLLKRKNSWSESAKRYNIPAPKGVLITGVPGCGKSLTAKAMSSIWQLPLLKLDMGKIFSGIVGSSEENMRRAIATAEAVSPSILWVDEIEKGLGGTGSTGDSGTSTRVFGTFLTWMQEKTAPVFVIATANNINSLPPELLRKGRFDEIFFVDLPTLEERKKIFEVHLKKRLSGIEVARNIVIDSEFLEKLALMTEGFVGAEIEQVVITALYEAFFNQRDIAKEDFYNAIESTVPLSVTQKESIMRLREWANVRAVSATGCSDRQPAHTEQKPVSSPNPKPEDESSDNSGSDGNDSMSSDRGGRILDF